MATTSRILVLGMVIQFFTVLSSESSEQSSDRQSESSSRQAIRPTQSKHYVKATFTDKKGTRIDYWLMSPAQVIEGRRYPLVLALHGRGGNTQAANELGSESLRKQFPCFVMAPVSTKAGHWLRPAGIGRKRGNPTKPMLSAALEAMDTVIRQHAIDSNRIYVTGQSMGGVGTFGALILRPGIFAAAMPVCGGWDPDDAGKMKKTAVWVFHGDMDKVVPTDYSRKIVAAMEKGGGAVKYTEYKGVGHNSWTKAYSSIETWKWLFTQRR